MSRDPIQTRAESNEQQALRHRAMLDRLASMAMDIAATIHAEAVAPPDPDTHRSDVTQRFERASRTVRRCLLLARKLAEPLPNPKPPGNAAAKPAQPPTVSPDRTAARKRIIREVQDAIDLTSRTHDIDVERLEAELLDRLDRPDLEHDLATRPIEPIIAEIARDLGVGRSPDPNVFIGKRRTPEDIDALATHAANPLPPPLHSGQPRPPRTPTRAPPPKPIEHPAETAAMLQALGKIEDEDL